MKQLPFEKNFTLPHFCDFSDTENVLLIVESRNFQRDLPHFECIIRNSLHQIDCENCAVVFACCESNLKSCQELIATIDCNASFKIVAKNIDSIDAYNDLLLSKEFWLFFKNKRVLLLQHDSCLLEQLPLSFFNYDLIGAVWPDKFNIAPPNNVGNGGLCIRNVNKMIKALDTMPLENVKISKQVSKAMRSSNLTKVPEDVFFAQALKWLGAKVAPGHVAAKFSVESVFANVDPIGYHQPWNSGNNKRWIKHVEKSFEQYTFLFCHIEKCGGTAVREIIRNVYEKDRNCFIPQFTTKATAKPQNFKQFSVFAYHVNYQDFLNSFSHSKLFSTTVLREPISRLISHFHAFDCKKDERLDQLDKSELEKYCKTIGHLTIQRLGRKTKTDTLEQMYKNAVKTLESMQVVGFLNDLPLYCERLSKATGRNFVSVGKRNINKQNIVYSDAFKLRLRNLLSSEVEFYEKALIKYQN